MKKYFLSFFLIIVFAFYVMLNNQSSVDVAPSSGNPVATNIGTNTPAPVSTGRDNGDNNGTTTTPATGTAPAPTPTPKPSSGAWTDGSYTGKVADAYFGNLQVKAIIQNGALSDVQVLQYPNDRGTSREINGSAMPKLVQEAVQAQSANVGIVSGATQSSEAFQQSLASALAQAKA